MEEIGLKMEGLEPVVAKEEKKGIKETMEILDALNKLVDLYKLAMENGKIGKEDLMVLFTLLKDIKVFVEAVKDIDKAIDEIKDLDTAEIVALSNTIIGLFNKFRK